jgi:Na+/melibiose symporter-like transporter
LVNLKYKLNEKRSLMENNKFERIIFILLRVFGVLTIVGGFLVFNNKTIIGNVYMISPSVLIGMIVSIIIYLIFIRFIAKHISISKKSIQ